MVCVRPLGAAGAGARTPRFRPRRIAVALLTVASVASAFGASTLTATAATTNRMAVVVEVDGVIHTAKVTFSADSISGLDALRSAGYNPLVRVFGANGGAVCALDVDTTTIGCPADGTCLTCDAPSYWGYYRAAAGATQYTYSRAGAGLSQVHDGDVEAWVWGTGSPPSRFVSFDDVWGAQSPPTTRPPATAPSTTRPTIRATAPTTAGAVAGVTTNPTTPKAATSGSATTTASNGARGSSTTARGETASKPTTDPSVGESDGGTNGNERKIATAPVVARGRGGSPFGLIAFAAVLAVLAAAIVLARRRRSLAAAGGHARS